MAAKEMLECKKHKPDVGHFVVVKTCRPPLVVERTGTHLCSHGR